jgi:peptidoglycan/xylan/chitin deacetylase (PgdA/CDA1 family)
MKRTPIPPFKFLAALVAGALLTGAVSYYQVELGSISPPPANNDTGLVVSDIHDAVAENRAAKSEREYTMSGKSADDVLLNLAALHNSKKWYAACQTLENLPGEELAVYDLPLHSSKYDAVIPCIARLREKLRAYWLQSRDDLDTHARFIAASNPVTTIERSITKSPRLLEPGEIVLVFEGGPYPSRTEHILDTLETAGVRADFFLSGDACRAYPEIARKLAQGEQILGSSGMNLSPIDQLALNESEQSILDGRDSVRTASGIKTPLFAFPEEATSRPLLEFLTQQRMIPLIMPGSSPLDSRDWQLASPSKLYDHVTDDAKEVMLKKQSALILFHDRFGATEISLPFILRNLLALGFKPVVVIV